MRQLLHGCRESTYKPFSGMSLIAMAVYDTEENQRHKLTERTLLSLVTSINLSRHSIVIVDNNSCKESKAVIRQFANACNNINLITNSENVGTAKAINQAWKLRKEGEHLIKMDNDVVIHSVGWVEQLEKCIERDPTIGIIGLKRKDCIESPERTDFYKSELKMLPHTGGEEWLVVEKVNHVMGTCQMYNSKLIDKIGGLYQMDGLYGFDDSLAAVRCQLAGFYNCFYPHINIDHIDPGTTDYQKWKEGYAGERMQQYNLTVQKLRTGEQSIYHEL